MLNLVNKIQRHKTLLSNIGSLSIVQFLNYLFPLVTLPYVVRVLGPSNFGLISFFIAFINYLNLITDYGFNLSGVRDVSANRDDSKKLSSIFSSVFYAKLLLFILSLIILLGSILSFELFNKNLSLLLVLALFTLGNLFYPQWFYQGLEKTKALPIINLFPRAIGVLLIFSLIKSSSDLILYAFLLGAVQFTVGIIAFIYSFSLTDLKLTRFNYQEVLLQLKSGWKVFLSSVSINFYTNTNIFLLGLIANETSVGIYSAADKIRIAIQGIFAPVSQSVFPKVNYLLSQSVSEFINFNKKLLRYQSSIVLLISIIVFIFAEPLVKVILGSQYLSSVKVLRILCWLPFIVSISNVYGIQILLTLREDKKFLQVVISAAFFSIILVTILTILYNEIGTALTFLITEIYVSILMFIFYKKIIKKNEV